MRDGSYYEGDFVKGEMNGKGTRTWEDGTVYAGAFIMGEKHGYGEIQYGARSVKEASFKGDFASNVRHGFGEMTLRDLTVIKGEFINNHPEGHCTISYQDGSEFSGNVVRGVINGLGEVKYPDGSAYKGSFVDGVKQGPGCYYIEPSVGGTYSMSGEFENGEPSVTANETIYELVGPIFHEEEQSKKAPAKGQETKQPTFTEEEDVRFENKVVFQVGGKFTEEPQELSFKIKCVF